MGELDPFAMRDKLPRSILISWEVFFELGLTELHEKWEYYFAALRNDIKSIMDGEPRSISEGLLKFESQSDQEIVDKQIQANEDFMATLAGNQKATKR